MRKPFYIVHYTACPNYQEADRGLLAGLSGARLNVRRSRAILISSSKEQEEKLAKELKGMGGELLRKNEKNSLFILPSEIKGDDHDNLDYLPEMKIQLINFRYFASVEEVIDSFDFTLCQFAYDGTYIYMSDFALWDTARKKLFRTKFLTPHLVCDG